MFSSSSTWVHRRHPSQPLLFFFAMEQVQVLVALELEAGEEQAQGSVADRGSILLPHPGLLRSPACQPDYPRSPFSGPWSVAADGGAD
jgi:hypothetical protein